MFYSEEKIFEDNFKKHLIYPIHYFILDCVKLKQITLWKI